MATEPLFDLLSYARNGPGRRARLSPAEIQQIARTVNRTPEVMVKLLSKGATTLKAVRKHLDYISRKGDLDIETDDGRTVSGDDLADELIEDWDLDLDDHRRRSDLTARGSKEPPRLVHKVIFSMPAGTPPAKVLGAVRNFCREEFALKHRYVMALHTDEPHPHVHVVLKAISEQGQRLNIRKATLREWRSEFARHLREFGVPANATDRFIRGETNPQKLDGIFRAMRDPNRISTHVRARVKAVAGKLLRGGLPDEPGKGKLVKTRREVENAWLEVGRVLRRAGHHESADKVGKFIGLMAPPLTENQQIAAELQGCKRGKAGEEVATNRPRTLMR